MQISHRRNGNVRLVAKSAGLFGRGQVLAVEAAKPIRKGEALSMDYGPGKHPHTPAHAHAHPPGSKGQASP